MNDAAIIKALIQSLEDAVGDLHTIRDVKGDIIITTRYEAVLFAAKAYLAGTEPEMKAETIDLVALGRAATPGRMCVSPTHWGSVGLETKVSKEQWDGGLLKNGEPHLKVVAIDGPSGLKFADAKFMAALWNKFRDDELLDVSTFLPAPVVDNHPEA
jgi:hypothetical protein